MANKKSGREKIRKLTKIGRLSVGLTLPIGLVRDLGWRERQRVLVTKKNGALVVRDAKTEKRKK